MDIVALEEVSELDVGHAVSQIDLSARRIKRSRDAGFEIHVGIYEKMWWGKSESVGTCDGGPCDDCSPANPVCDKRGVVVLGELFKVDPGLAFR